MAQLDPSIPLQAFSQRKRPSMLDQLQQSAPIADFMQKQRQQEQLADIFGRNIQRTPEGGLEMNQQNALAELYATQPTNALEFDKTWKANQAQNKYQQLIDDQGNVNSYNYATGRWEPSLNAQGMPVKARESFNPLMTDQGIFSFGRNSQAVAPVTAPLGGASPLMPEGKAKGQAELKLKKEENARQYEELSMKKKEAFDKNVKEIGEQLKFKQANTALFDEMSTFANLADSVAKNPNITYVTGKGKLISYIPGTKSADLAAQLGRLQAMSTLNKMGELKAQSATGATGMGSTNEKEFATLENAKSTLSNTNQSPMALAKELKRVANSTRKIISDINNFESIKLKEIRKLDPSYQMDFGGQIVPPIGTISNGYRFKGGNPNDQTAWEKVK